MYKVAQYSSHFMLEINTMRPSALTRSVLLTCFNSARSFYWSMTHSCQKFLTDDTKPLAKLWFSLLIIIVRVCLYRWCLPGRSVFNDRLGFWGSRRLLLLFFWSWWLLCWGTYNACTTSSPGRSRRRRINTGFIKIGVDLFILRVVTFFEKSFEIFCYSALGKLPFRVFIRKN